MKLFSSLSGWKARCAEYFPYSTYFEGKYSSAISRSSEHQICCNSENGGANHTDNQNADSIASNGKLEAFKNLAI